MTKTTHIPTEVLSSGELLLLTHDAMAKLVTLRKHVAEFPIAQQRMFMNAFNQLGLFAQWVLAEEAAAHAAFLARTKGNK